MCDCVRDIKQVVKELLVLSTGYGDNYRYDPTVGGVVCEPRVVCYLLLLSLC